MRTSRIVLNSIRDRGVDLVERKGDRGEGIKEEGRYRVVGKVVIG